MWIAFRLLKVLLPTYNHMFKYAAIVKISIHKILITFIDRNRDLELASIYTSIYMAHTYVLLLLTTRSCSHGRPVAGSCPACQGWTDNAILISSVRSQWSIFIQIAKCLRRHEGPQNVDITKKRLNKRIKHCSNRSQNFLPRWLLTLNWWWKSLVIFIKRLESFEDYAFSQWNLTAYCARSSWAMSNNLTIFLLTIDVSS